MKHCVAAAFFLSIFTLASPAKAFNFTQPSEGDIVIAGSRLKVVIDPGKNDPLFGVLLTSSRGIVQSKLDSLPPFKWSITIPMGYFGPLTLRATGRRYAPVPNPPSASVTIFVVYPAIPVQKSFFSAPPLPQR